MSCCCCISIETKHHLQEILYNKVTLTLTTDDSDGLTTKDFDRAQVIFKE
ncbi:4a-hydroxytetrahydrobiopterin dehydratase [Coleofasciculus sp. FACHB-129]|nr:4a-hydroxytetrahydrobiopterin dehydratase [Coleofasciculus sp. FACHB-129]